MGDGPHSHHRDTEAQGKSSRHLATRLSVSQLISADWLWWVHEQSLRLSLP